MVDAILCAQKRPKMRNPNPAISSPTPDKEPVSINISPIIPAIKNQIDLLSKNKKSSLNLLLKSKNIYFSFLIKLTLPVIFDADRHHFGAF